jgi:hypothetical protein
LGESLDYALARWQDPETGRFTSLDPARDGLNWYVYCANNPIAFVDPTGLEDTNWAQNDWISQLEATWNPFMNKTMAEHNIYIMMGAIGNNLAQIWDSSRGGPFATGGPGDSGIEAGSNSNLLYMYKIGYMDKEGTFLGWSNYKGPISGKELVKLEKDMTGKGYDLGFGKMVYYMMLEKEYVGYIDSSTGKTFYSGDFYERWQNVLEGGSNKSEDKEIIEQLLPSQADPFFQSPLKVHSIRTSGFGRRWSNMLQKWEFHGGVDQACLPGTEVYATAPGEVLFVHEDKKINETEGGSYIIIKHANGYTSHYYHLSAIFVKVGDPVTNDTIIALSGGAKNAVGSGWHTEGPHLHFMIKLTAVRFNHKTPSNR